MNMVRRLAIWTLKPLFLAFGTAAYLIIRLIEPWRRVVVSLLTYDRLGHLANNTECYLRRLAANPEREKIFSFFVCGPPANRQLLTMIQRRIFVSESIWLRRPVVDGLIPLVKGTRFHETLADEDLAFSDWDRVPPQLSFIPEEEERGRRLLSELGIPDGAPFVCFHARDKTYLDRTLPHATPNGWSYHDYRDCDIDNYVPAAEMLASKGIYALRMGVVVAKPIRSTSPRVIDYATRRRSDFGDIFLLARCKFFLGSDSGPIAVPTNFNVPIAIANLSTIGIGLAGMNTTYIIKKYWSVNEKRLLNFREIVAMGADRWYTSQKFQAAGIQHVENTPEEIAGLAEEINARVDGTWLPDPEADALQKRFLSFFPAGHPILSLPSRLGAHFLKTNAALFD